MSKSTEKRIAKQVAGMLTADQATILALSNLKPSITSDLELRDSLLEQYNRKGDLTAKQWHYARRLVKGE